MGRIADPPSGHLTVEPTDLRRSRMTAGPAMAFFGSATSTGGTTTGDLPQIRFEYPARPQSPDRLRSTASGCGCRSPARPGIAWKRYRQQAQEHIQGPQAGRGHRPLDLLAPVHSPATRPGMLERSTAGSWPRRSAGSGVIWGFKNPSARRLPADPGLHRRAAHAGDRLVFERCDDFTTLPEASGPERSPRWNVACSRLCDHVASRQPRPTSNTRARERRPRPSSSAMASTSSSSPKARPQRRAPGPIPLRRLRGLPRPIVGLLRRDRRLPDGRGADDPGRPPKRHRGPWS